MTQEIDQIVDRWLKRIPEAEHAYRDDPQYHQSLKLMHRTLIALNMAMEDEGIPEDVRLRVVRAVMHGAPDEIAAEERMKQRQQQVEEALRHPARLVRVSAPPWGLTVEELKP